MGQINVTDGFWNSYIDLLKEVVMPYQWDALNDNIPDAEKSYAVKNMKIAAGLEQGEFRGFVFQDSDLYKWIEAAGYILAKERDDELEAKVDEIVGYMEKAQQPDGYLDSYFIINGMDKRFTNLKDCHELYCMGHLIEAAVAYYDATGKRAILDIACRFADLAYETFGDSTDKLKGYPGHQVAEMALVKLYNTTGEAKYIELAEFFINQRGKEPNYFIEEWEKREEKSFWDSNDKKKPNVEYNQAHKPVREQTKATGHAVRAVYMYAGMAGVAREKGDKSLFDACRVLFDNIVNKQMYITGGIGQTRIGEAFTFDYDLPNNTVYAETCASIGLIFFAYEMFLSHKDSIYTDTIETALYNTVIGGMARDGKHFFYVNPLEVWPAASEKNPDQSAVKPIRQKWFGCSCCPPNVARLLASLEKYIYTKTEDSIYVNLYIGSSGAFDIGGKTLTVTQTTDYPWGDFAEIAVGTNTDYVDGIIAVRIPAWCENATVFVNGEEFTDKPDKGYVYIKRAWRGGDRITVNIPMDIRFMKSNTNVRANAGKVAVTRGPLVYCAEEGDNSANIAALSIIPGGSCEYCFDKELLGGVGVILAEGTRDVDNNPWLYHEVKLGNGESSEKSSDIKIKLIPYFAWGNRGENEMSVWIRQGR